MRWFQPIISRSVSVPSITIVGTCKVLVKDSLVFHPHDVEMFISPAIATADTPNDQLEALIARVRNEMVEPLIPLGLAGAPEQPAGAAAAS